MDSHIVPAWTYKRVRADGDAHPDPVFLESGVALQTSKQVTEYLLCKPCEDLISPAEDYVARITYQKDGTAPIKSMWGPPLTEVSNGWAYGANGLKTDLLANFVASVVWRAHCSTELKTDLGPFAEDFRAYLLGRQPFPKMAAALVIVFEDVPGKGCRQHRLVTFPKRDKIETCSVHRFIVCGLAFWLLVGSRIPLAFKDHCLVRGEPKVIVTNATDKLVDYVAHLVRAAKPKGRLAKR